MASHIEIQQDNNSSEQATLRRNETGFDCEFVDTPSKEVQSECPVCLQIIREPHQVTCCGYSFCRSCIEQIKTDKKSCPTCNKHEFEVFPDKRLERSLYVLKVRCSLQKDGCKWTGELKQLDEHFNIDPLPGNQLNGCQFAEIDCLYCEKKMQRQYIQTHQTEECTKRPFSCEHCHDYESNLADVLHNHWPACGLFPVRCSNECGLIFQRQNMDSHIADECPQTIITCDFLSVGCSVKLPRKDMPEHLRENLSIHTSLLATSHAEQQAVIANLVAENETLKSKNENLEHNYRSLETNNDNLQVEVTILKDKIQALEKEDVSTQKQAKEILGDLVPRTTIPLGPPVMAVTNVEQHKLDLDHWYSPPSYTHHQGYKFCLKVSFKSWGSGSGIEVIVSIHFMRGEFDDSLKWPFRGVFWIRIMDQVKGQGHKHYKVTYNDDDVSVCDRERREDIARLGKEVLEFLTFPDPTEQAKYIRNDTLLLQIYKVELH